VSLGPTVQAPSPRFAGLLWHQRHFESVLAVAPPLARHRGGGNLEGIRDPLVGPAIRATGVGLEQDAGVKQCARVSPASAEELFEMIALLVGEPDYVLLVHGETPVGSVPTRIQARVLLLNQSVTED
jgi:hypothetical protein